jgi:hypothetical protein
MVHDFWNREEYHCVLKYLDTEEKVDRLGVFRLKADISLPEIEAEYEHYKFVSI